VRIIGTIRQLLSACSIHMHEKRRKSVADAVVALLSCGRVVAASLGRAIAKRGNHKHGIKRIDRLLGNTKLHGELRETYAALAAFTVGGTRHPVVLIDWTELGRDKCALKAVLALQGRGVPLYSECHSIRVQGNARIHKTFLARLADVLPPGCVPIVVTDAAFKRPWMQAVQARGWHFVTRVRGRTCARIDENGTWFSAKSCASWSKHGVFDFPNAELNWHQPLRIRTRLVIADLRSARARRPPRQAGRRIRVRRAVKGASEPWLLATSLRECPADEIASIYAFRMQIEESIRDVKSHSFGWGFEDARCKTCRRIEVQLLLVAIATIAALLAGIATELASQARRFQANTERRRRVLSLVTLGRCVLSLDDSPWITPSLLIGALWWLTNHAPRLHAESITE
jgi:hypothetical protein